jgi:hypothetical protein
MTAGYARNGCERHSFQHVHEVVRSAPSSSKSPPARRRHLWRVARIVARFPGGIEPPVPLLTSIDEHRDVALVRALHAGEKLETDPAHRAALDHLVASWQPVKHYGPRIAERSKTPPSHYRLAVTESGIQRR